MSQLLLVGRYALFQLPELGIVGFAILVALRFEVVSPTWAGILFAAWVLKEIALFPFVRQAYEPSDPRAASKLVGALAVVTERLDPEGRVRIGPEHWRACVASGATAVESGARVCVKSVEGLTLHVELPETQREGAAEAP
jgi:membrane protein implicated in regulation of membrane protease activity